MKTLIRYPFAIVILALIHSFQPVFADVKNDAERLFDWAESTYPGLFPSVQTTRQLPPWFFRYYPESGVYAGVNQNDHAVYLLGGPWGNEPAKIDLLANLLAIIDSGTAPSQPDDLFQIGRDIYQQSWRTGCGFCHDQEFYYPPLRPSIKTGMLNRHRFGVELQFHSGTPRGDQMIMEIDSVRQANLTLEQAIDAIYLYLSETE